LYTVVDTALHTGQSVYSQFMQISTVR